MAVYDPLRTSSIDGSMVGMTAAMDMAIYNEVPGGVDLIVGLGECQLSMVPESSACTCAAKGRASCGYMAGSVRAQGGLTVPMCLIGTPS